MTKAFTQAHVDLFQLGDPKDVIGKASAVGFSSSDEGIRRLESLFIDIRAQTPSRVLESSDISGMDWSVGNTY